MEVSANPPTVKKISVDIEKEIDELDSIASKTHELKDSQREFQRQIDELENSLEQVEIFSGLELDFKYLSGFDSVKVFAGEIPDDADTSSLDSDLEVVNILSYSKENTFSVAIIPYTWDNTNLKNINVGDTVNLEFDIVGKYIAKLLSKS